MIFRQGERGQAFYIVEEGILEAIRCNAEGHELWRDTLVAGDHFGEGSLLYGLDRRVTITAQTAATLMVFSSKEFKNFISGFKGLSQLPSYTAQREALEEILDKKKWPSDLLTSPVEAAMNHSVSCIPETATINEVVQGGVIRCYCPSWIAETS